MKTVKEIHIERLSEKLLRVRLDQAARISGEINICLISAGRGRELSSETFKKTDPLSILANKARNNHGMIIREMEARREYHGSLKPIKRSVFI